MFESIVKKIKELKGWERTFVLAAGGALGVLATAYIIHKIKGG